MNNHTDFMAKDEIDKIIHEPGRLKIVIQLYMVEKADFIFLLHKTGLSKGNLSSHLSKLESAGYVDIRKTFVDKIPRTLLSLTAEGRSAFDNYKGIMENLLEL